MKKKVVIIGSGIGGLASACILGQAGYNVTIYEKNAYPGGRAGQFKAKRFTFNYGPSWYLMPDVFEHFFELLGEDVNQLELKKLSPSYRVFLKDTLLRNLDIFSDKTRDEGTFESLEPGAKLALRDYLDKSAYQYKFAKENFLYKNYDSWLDFFTRQMIQESTKLNLLRNYHSDVARYFKAHELQKIIEFPVLFLGTDPKKAPAFYGLLNHCMFNQGTFYPAGGMSKLAETLVDFAKARGVQIVYKSPIEKIVVKDGLATGVRKKSGKLIKADIVISNADMAHTELKLLNPQYRTYSKHYWQKRVVAPSALLIYLGVKGKYSNLEHHNLVFSKDWDANISLLFKKKAWPSDPSFYVSNPSKTDKSIAPKGHENIVVLVPIAPGTNKYDQAGLERYADHILEIMEHTMHLQNLRKKIVYKRLFAVQDFENEWNSYKGSALGPSHTLKQSAAFRPKNFSEKVSNLYYVGANTVPGIGVPMALISAELIYKRLLNDKGIHPLKKI